jgi:hypothetical protein
MRARISPSGESAAILAPPGNLVANHGHIGAYNRFMLRAGKCPSRNGNWLRLTVLTIAIAAVLFVAAGASLWHLDAPGSEATCPICHLAHMPALRGLSASTLTEPVLISWIVPAEAQVSHAAPVSLDSPPRGPPTA